MEENENSGRTKQRDMLQQIKEAVRIADGRIEDRMYEDYVTECMTGFPPAGDLMTAAEFKDYTEREPDSFARQQDLIRRRKEAEVRWLREELAESIRRKMQEITAAEEKEENQATERSDPEGYNEIIGDFDLGSFQAEHPPPAQEEDDEGAAGLG